LDGFALIFFNRKGLKGCAQGTKKTLSRTLLFFAQPLSPLRLKSCRGGKYALPKKLVKTGNIDVVFTFEKSKRVWSNSAKVVQIVFTDVPQKNKTTPKKLIKNRSICLPIFYEKSKK